MLKNILTKECNLNNIKIYKGNNTFSYCVAGNKQTKRIYNYLYNKANIYLERKYKKWSEHIANVDG